MKWLTQDLATLSGGRGGRAVLILLVTHLLAALGALLLWVFGLHPFFDDHHWIAATIAVVYAVVAVLGLLLRFGVWGTGAQSGRDYGENYEVTFSPRTGFALGWFRWFVQLVCVMAVTLVTIMTVMDVRWWHFTGTEELDALSGRAASMPVPDSWTLDETEASQTGFPEFMEMSGSDGPHPQGFVEQTFVVPAAYTFTDLKTWLDSPDWAGSDEDGAFGAIQREQCVEQSTWCDVRRVPPSGQQPEYFIRADFTEPASAGNAPEVELRMTYRQYEEPDWGVFRETVDRARSVPVPSDWSRFDASADETQNGEDFTQRYTVPEDFTREDLEAWVTGPAWSDPATGEAFGELELDSPPCRTIGPDDEDYMCSAIVDGTQRTGDGWFEDPVEVVSFSLQENHTVRVRFSRNG